MPILISDYYKEQNKKLHESKEKYGERGGRHKGMILGLMDFYECESLLDYGCGNGNLSRHLDFQIQSYDPGVPEYDIDPRPADLVVCTDVLEHIEPELLDNVLKHIQELTNKVVYFVVATRYDRTKTLPDGSNPHKIVKNPVWWGKTLTKYFVIERQTPKVGEVELICTPLNR